MVPTNIENVFIKFNAGGKKLIVGCIYRPPISNFDDFLEDSQRILCQLQAKNTNAFILGDFNIDVSSASLIQSKLIDLFTEFAFNQVIKEYTRISDNSSTTIDLIFTNCFTSSYEASVIPNNITDHYITNIQIDLKYRKHERIIHYRPTHKINIDDFISLLQQNLMNVTDFTSFHNIFINCLNKVCPYVKSKSKKPFAPWITESDIQNLIKIKKSLKRQFKTNPLNNEIKNQLRSNKKDLDKMIKHHRKNYLSNVACKADAKSLWWTIKQLLHNNSSTNSIDCNIFNNFYINNSFSLTKRIPVETSKIHDFIHSSKDKQTAFDFKNITFLELEMELSHLKSNKTDMHGINSSLLKNISHVLLPFLLHYVNTCIFTANYPNSLKCSQLLPIPKSNKSSNNPKDYRPIAIQPMFSKVFERVLLIQINAYLDHHDVLDQNQFGFRKGKSTEHLLHLLYNRIAQNLKNGLLSVIVSLDMSKAFDTLDHFSLIEKLQNIGFSKSAQSLILSYLRERSVFTSSNNSISSSSHVLSGVPQGSILGPILFNIYINDFIKSFSNANVFQYADDCQILLSFSKDHSFTDIITSINSTIIVAEKWCSDNFLCLNKSKTQILPIFNRNSSYSRMPFYKSSTTSSHFSILSSPSPLSFNFIPYCKILGVYFNNKLSWSDHFHYQNSQLQKSFYSFKLLFNRYTAKNDSSLRFNILRKTIIPKMTYAISLFHINNAHCNKIWLSWNRRICSLTLRKFARTEDTHKLHLLTLQQWCQCKLIILAHSYLKKQSYFLKLQYSTNSFNTRSKHSITTQLCAHSTERQVANTWNNLPNNTKDEILKKQKLKLKDILKLLCL